MKTNKLLATSLLLTGLLAQPLIGQLVYNNIPDDYWGGDPTSSAWDKDLIGDNNVFQLTGADVVVPEDRSGFTVRLYGNYFDNILSRSNLLNTVMGDLFISTDGLGHSLTGSASLADYLGQPTKTEWEYGVRLGTYIDTTGNLLEGQSVQSGTVHQFADRDTNPTLYNSQIQWSYANSGYIYRAGQEVQIKSDTPQVNTSSASWFIDTSGPADFLSITLSNFDLSGVGRLGLHWTMTCANDVLEFEVALPPEEQVIPEPATVGLLGMGGLGLILFLRKRVRAAR